MDLDERLVDYLEQETGQNIILGSVPPNGHVAVLQDPGSADNGQPYFNGNREMVMNFEACVNTGDYVAARAVLTPIAEAVQKINENNLKSSDGSFTADSGRITGYPYQQLLDTAGNTYWFTTFVVQVTAVNDRKE